MTTTPPGQHSLARVPSIAMAPNETLEINFGRLHRTHSWTGRGTRPDGDKPAHRSHAIHSKSPGIDGRSLLTMDLREGVCLLHLLLCWREKGTKTMGK